MMDGLYLKTLNLSVGIFVKQQWEVAQRQVFFILYKEIIQL